MSLTKPIHRLLTGIAACHTDAVSSGLLALVLAWTPHPGGALASSPGSFQANPGNGHGPAGIAPARESCEPNCMARQEQLPGGVCVPTDADSRRAGERGLLIAWTRQPDASFTPAPGAQTEFSEHIDAWIAADVFCP